VFKLHLGKLTSPSEALGQLSLSSRVAGPLHRPTAECVSAWESQTERTPLCCTL